MFLAKSGRSSPVLVPNYELDEIASEASTQPNAMISTKEAHLSAAEIKKRARMQAEYEKLEQKNKVRAAAEQRRWMEEQLFRQPAPDSLDMFMRPQEESDESAASSVQNSPPMPTRAAEKLAALQKPEPASRKQKQRSKKASKMSSGRSNDRKCNKN